MSTRLSRRSRPWIALVMVALSWAALPQPALAGAPTYSLYLLPLPAGTYVSGTALMVNDAGDAVGEVSDSAQAFHIVMWPGGQMPGIELKDPAANLLPQVHHINALGQVAGGSSKGPTLWDRGGNATVLATPGTLFNSTTAIDINEQGAVVGYTSRGGHVFGQLWLSAQTAPASFNDQAGGNSWCYPVDINASGAVAGNGSVSGANGTPVPHPFWRSPDGVLHDIAYAADPSAIISTMGLNDSNQVTGSIDAHFDGSTDFHARAFVWTAATGLVALPTFGDRTDLYQPVGISNSGVVVGSNQWNHAGLKNFLWTAQDGLLSLKSQIKQWPAGVNHDRVTLYQISPGGLIAGYVDSTEGVALPMLLIPQ